MKFKKLSFIPALHKPDYAAWLSPFFKNGDCALTLTFREIPQQYNKWYQPNYDLYAKHIHHYLNVVNRTFLGNEWKAGRRKLKCAYTFEQNSSYGVHAHMILETPPLQRIVKNKHPYYLRRIWADMKHTGEMKGTDFTEAHDAAGWLKYMFKDIQKADSTTVSFNVADWHLHAA
jgi:hypothetical protein